MLLQGTGHCCKVVSWGTEMLARGALAVLVCACQAMAAVPLQPLAQQVRRLEDAMNYLGQPFPAADQAAINTAIANPDESAAVGALEKILDRYALAIVDINA